MTNTTGHPQPTNQPTDQPTDRALAGAYGYPSPMPTGPMPASPMPASPMPASALPLPPRPTDPGRGLGIAGLVLAPFTGLLGAILALVALRRSSRAGFRNRPALAGVIIGLLVTALSVTMIIVSVVAIGGVVDACRELGPGQHVVNGVTYTCG